MFYAAAMLGAVVVPIVHFYGPKEVGYILRRTNVKAFVTMDRFGLIDFLANLDRLREAGDLDGVELLAVVANDAATPPTLPEGARAVRRRSLAGAADRRPGRCRSRLARRRRLHVGHDRRPEGRHPLAPHRRRRGAPARRAAGAERGAATSSARRSGTPSGCCRRLLIPPTQGKPINLVDVWNPPHILRVMAEQRLSCGSGATFFLTSLLDHPDRTDEHLELMALHRPGRLGRARRGRRSGRRRSASRWCGCTARPSTRRSPVPRTTTPLDKRIASDGAPARRRRPPAGRRRRPRRRAGRAGRDPQPGARVLRGLHRPDAHRGRVRRRRLVPHRRHRHRRRRRLPAHHRPQEGRDHPRRRERQRGRGRGGADAAPRHRRGRGRRRARSTGSPSGCAPSSGRCPAPSGARPGVVRDAMAEAGLARPEVARGARGGGRLPPHAVGQGAEGRAARPLAGCR